jgi:hypothetical protein
LGPGLLTRALRGQLRRRRLAAALISLLNILFLFRASRSL